jgi:hypothetical protein
VSNLSPIRQALYYYSDACRFGRDYGDQVWCQLSNRLPRNPVVSPEEDLVSVPHGDLDRCIEESSHLGFHIDLQLIPGSATIYLLQVKPMRAQCKTNELQVHNAESTIESTIGCQMENSWPSNHISPLTTESVLVQRKFLQILSISLTTQFGKLYDIIKYIGIMEIVDFTSVRWSLLFIGGPCHAGTLAATFSISGMYCDFGR